MLLSSVFPRLSIYVKPKMSGILGRPSSMLYEVANWENAEGEEERGKEVINKLALGAEAHSNESLIASLQYNEMESQLQSQRVFSCTCTGLNESRLETFGNNVMYKCVFITLIPIQEAAGRTTTLSPKGTKCS